MAVSATGSSTIDVASLVSQLMTVESQPLVRLQQQQSAVQARLSAFGQVQSALSTLQSALDKLRSTSTFGAAQATASGDAATASVTGTPAPGQYAVTVTQLARAQSFASDPLASGTASVGAGSLTLTAADGSTLGTVDFGGSGQPATLSELAGAINSLNVAVRVSIISDSQGARLALTASDTGSAKAFNISVSGGTAELAALATPKQTAQDALFNINGIDLKSASNVVQGAIDGVMLNLVNAPAPGSPSGTTTNAQIAVNQDANAIKSAVNDFINAFNALDKLGDTLTRYDATNKQAAVLTGDSSMWSLQNSLRSVALGTRTGASGELTRLADVGISFQQDGTLKLDDSKFAQALAADSGKVMRLFTATSTTDSEQGFAVRLGKLVSSFTDVNGLLTSRQQGLQASIRQLTDRQTQMQENLDRVKQRLTDQYSKLDALLTSRQAQSDALANALAGLPNLNNSSNSNNKNN